MKLIDWIAILGALAWAPHLIGVLKSWILKPKVRIITQKSVEIGFTTSGPIFNVRLAFAVENKDIVVSDIKIMLKHDSGEERVFEWQGITQHLGKMKMPNLGEMPYEKEHAVLAVKLNQKDIEERFVRFQEPTFINSKREYEKKAMRKMEYLKAEGKYDKSRFLREQEMTDLYSFNKQAFPWKQGRYTVTIEMQSPEKFIVIDNVREFDLTPVDIDCLEKNKKLLEIDYERMILGIDEEDDEFEWQWCHPVLLKPSDKDSEPRKPSTSNKRH